MLPFVIILETAAPREYSPLLFRRGNTALKKTAFDKMLYYGRYRHIYRSLDIDAILYLLSELDTICKKAEKMEVYHDQSRH